MIIVALVDRPGVLQWGRLVEETEGMLVAVESEFPGLELQWGRLVEETEGPDRSSNWSTSDWLQWGRLVEETEGYDQESENYPENIASMGPPR